MNGQGESLVDYSFKIACGVVFAQSGGMYFDHINSCHSEIQCFGTQKKAQLSMAKQDLPLDVLKTVTVFAGIDEEHLVRLCEQCKMVSVKAGKAVVEEGTPATEIYIILSGKLKVVLNAKEEPLEIVELFPGHCVGEASVIGVQNHSATVIVEEDAQLLELSRKVLMDISNYDKDLFSIIILNIARELARRLYHTDRLLLEMSRWEKKHKKS